MENQNKVIDLRKTLLTIWYYKFHIMITAIIITGIYGIYLYVGHSHAPVYQASSSIYVAENQVKENVVNGSSDHVIQDYASLIQGDFILKNIGSNQSNDINGDITAAFDESSHIITITVSSNNPKTSADVANRIAAVSCEKLSELSDYYSVYLSKEAVIPTSPIENNDVKILLKFFAIILFCLIIGVVLWYLIKNSVTDELRLKKKLEAGFMIHIPELRISKYKKIENLSTIFRKLYLQKKDFRGSVLITSFGTNEGKSFIALGYALQCAEHNLNVLLVNMDSKASRSRKLYSCIVPEFNNNSQGIIKVSNYTVDIMKLPADDFEYIESGKFAQYYNSICSQYDIVIFDGRSFNFDENYILADYCSNAFIVADPNKRNENQILSVQSMLQNHQCKVSGIVLNREHF